MSNIHTTRFSCYNKSVILQMSEDFCYQLSVKALRTFSLPEFEKILHLLVRLFHFQFLELLANLTSRMTSQLQRILVFQLIRGLNAVTHILVHPMPLVQENIDRLRGNKYFTLVDTENAYYRIPIREHET